MSTKRKSEGKARVPKKAKKNGKSKHDEDLSDFDDFGSDASNDGSHSPPQSDNDDAGNDVDDLLGDNEALVCIANSLNTYSQDGSPGIVYVLCT